MRKLRSLLRATRGAVTIELAIAAPVLATMLIGLVDISTAYSAKLRLEQIAQRTIEKIQAAGFETGDEDALEEEAVAAAVAAGLTGASADLTYWLECDGEPSASFTTACTDGQVVARYVELDIQHTFSPFVAARFTNSNADGTMTVHGVAGIRF